MMRQDETPLDSPAVDSLRVPLLSRIDIRGGSLLLAIGGAFVLSPGGDPHRSGPPRSDEGALLAFGALTFLLPIGTLLVAAGVARWRGYGWGRAFHFLALLWPFLIVGIFSRFFFR
jgi:hypothetical protein